MLFQNVGWVCTCRLLHTSMSKNLGLAHLSYCSPNNSMTGRMQYMKINPSMTLRYGTYIDTSAPLFGWWFLRQFVVETLVEAEKGDSGKRVQQLDTCHPARAAVAYQQQCQSLYSTWILTAIVYVTVSQCRVESAQARVAAPNYLGHLLCRRQPWFPVALPSRLS